MGKADWAWWQATNPRQITLRDIVNRPCADCPAAYAREMRLIERCNGSCPGDLVYVARKVAA